MNRQTHNVLTVIGEQCSHWYIYDNTPESGAALLRTLQRHEVEGQISPDLRRLLAQKVLENVEI